MEVRATGGASNGSLALPQSGLGLGEVGCAEAGEDLNRTLGVGQGLGAACAYGGTEVALCNFPTG